MKKEIYLCSADKDRAHEDRIRDGLKPILPKLGLTLWGRTDLKGGETWKEVMKGHLAQAEFFVALISSDSLASDMCYIEMQAAQYRTSQGLHIVSILLRPCAFEYSELVNFPVLPKQGKSITEQKNTDSAWLEVQRDLIEMIRATHRYLN
jgi:hypothetical protein